MGCISFPVQAGSNPALEATSEQYLASTTSSKHKDLTGISCCLASVQVPSEKVALAQKMLITKANIAGKFVVS